MNATKILMATALLAAFAIPASATETIDQRLRRVENKTDYWHKTVRTITKHTRIAKARSTAKAASLSAADPCQGAIAGLNYATANADSGLVNVWATASAQWQGAVPGMTIGMRLDGQEVSNPVPLCHQDYDTSGLAAADLKLFCQFTVQPAAVISVELFGNNADKACQFGSASITVKMVEQQMPEPPDPQ